MLRLENVCYRYHKKKMDVLHDINYNFNKGLVYAIMGHSGSGKTTLLSLLARLDNPTKGNIFYNDCDIKKINLNVYRARYVSIIFQSYNLLYKYSALDNVLMALNVSRFCGDKINHASSILDTINLAKEKHTRTVTNLSGGEQQRVATARAIASNADIILADEPTGNLDSINTRQVMDMLLGLKEKHQKCVIIVTHDERIADQADVIINIDDGKLNT
ncbi:MAG: ABC transporter ATP-binding protein [Defluviitaleaceae bacterium]|nr:ABC transporter ATP-binding protein [Defluviitaleaceae bacterium]MCL2273366.1 ABC transporter ATP-binding protein [Defluviitaleaceae bacterium]